MDADTWKEVKQVFNLAIELPVEERRAFVRHKCGSRPTVMQEVLELLAEDEDAAANDRQLPNLAELCDLAPKDPKQLIGQSIGPYALLEVLGEGGMGVVFLAEQVEPVRRKVALKLLLGRLSDAYVNIFRKEQQVMALLEHPNIASVYDFGTAEDGPYFVMEYIQGQPLLEYCDSQRLDLRARIELFVRICDAVAYAHRNGIVHRDIKPANVLVSLQHHQPIPKIIDFGIAKSINRTVSPYSLSDYGVFVGTPLYMSPEQAGVLPHEVDFRADIYSLSMLFYELLTGILPVPQDALLQVSRIKNFFKQVELIHGSPLPKPSRRLRDLGRLAEAFSEARRMRAKELIRALEEDLDWVVMKGLAKLPQDRYAGMPDMIEDLHCWLRGCPLHSKPRTLVYGLSKKLKSWSGRYGRSVRLYLNIVLLAALALLLWRYRQAVTAQPDTPAPTAVAEAVFLGGKQHMARQAWSSAIPYFEVCLDQERLYPEAKLALAECLLHLRQFDLALRHNLDLINATSQDELRGSALVQRARIHSTRGHFAEAYLLLDQAADLFARLHSPDGMRSALTGMGICRLLQQRPGEAKLNLHQALYEHTPSRGKPAGAKLELLLGVAAAQLDNSRNAQALTEQALETFRLYECRQLEMLALGTLSSIEFQRRDYPEALRHARQALHATQDDPLSNHALVPSLLEAQALLEAGEFAAPELCLAYERFLSDMPLWID